MDTAAILSPEDMHKKIHATGFKFHDLKKYRVSKNFTWAEVFSNRTIDQVRGASELILTYAENQARRMEQVRTYLRTHLAPNAVITVTSWYRPPAVNSDVGGATSSRHLIALATDFVVPGFSGLAGNRKVQACLLQALQQKAIGAGMSLEITGGYPKQVGTGNWTHIDARDGGVFAPTGGGWYKTLSPAEQKSFIERFAV